MEGKKKKDLVNGGSKKSGNPDQWKCNVSKKARSSGQSYERKTGDIVPEKRFRIVNKCCALGCYKNVEVSSQQYLFEEFWKRGKSKQIQDMILASCLKRVAVKRHTEKPTSIRRSNQWKYSIRLGTVDVRICLSFLMQLYQLSQRKIRVIQKKVLRGETSFRENRGRHLNRPNRTPDYVLNLMKEHLSSVPSDQMYHTPASGARAGLVNFTKLYNEFKRYYEDKTETPLPITLRRYRRLYHEKSEVLASASKPTQDKSEVLASAPKPAANENLDFHSVEVVILPAIPYRYQNLQQLYSADGLPQPHGLHNDPLSLSPIDRPNFPDVIHHQDSSLRHDGSSGSGEINTPPNPLIPACEMPAECVKIQDNSAPTVSSNVPQQQEDTPETNTSSAKPFVAVDRCCVQKCYKQFEVSSQRYLHDEFWNRGKSKQLQDMYLASCLKNVNIKMKTAHSSRSQRQQWNYFIQLGAIDVRVCLSFVLNLYQISSKRIRVIQNKILLGDTSFVDGRGRRTGKKHTLPPKVVSLMKIHPLLIPYYESNNRKYFLNPDIDLKKLFQAFRQYYREQTGTVLTITLATYSRLFRSRSEFNFSTTCVDECDFCANLDATGFPTEDQLNERVVHEDVCNVYSALKDSLIEQAKSGDILMIEFDYLPNICVPRLNLTEELYKQLPFVYGFNVHCHCDDSSYMYLFSESKSAKDIDTVISCIFATIQPILESNHSYQKVLLLCNDCQGQSKHPSLLQFCSWMSVIHNIPFRQIFPIRGHSTNICSHNYALFREKNKRRKRLINVKPILVDMVSARMYPSSFIVAYNSPIIECWTEALNKFFSAQPKHDNRLKFLVKSYQQLEHANGNVYANTTFYNDSQYWLEFTYLIRNLNVRNIALQPFVSPGVSPAIRENVFSFFRFLTAEEIIKFQESFGV